MQTFITALENTVGIVLGILLPIIALIWILDWFEARAEAKSDREYTARKLAEENDRKQKENAILKAKYASDEDHYRAVMAGKEEPVITAGNYVGGIPCDEKGNAKYITPKRVEPVIPSGIGGLSLGIAPDPLKIKIVEHSSPVCPENERVGERVQPKPGWKGNPNVPVLIPAEAPGPVTYITKTDVAGILGLSVRSITSLVKDKKLRVYKLTGRCVRFLESEVREDMKNLDVSKIIKEETTDPKMSVKSVKSVVKHILTQRAGFMKIRDIEEAAQEYFPDRSSRKVRAAIATCISQNPDLFERVDVGTYALKDPYASLVLGEETKKA